MNPNMIMVLSIQLVTIASCEAQSHYVLQKTKWVNKVADNCVDFYEFGSQKKFKFYDCELEDTLYGSYYFMGDTLMLDEKGSVSDRYLPIDSDQRVRRSLYKTIIKNDTLFHIVKLDWRNNHFENSNFQFTNGFPHTKVEKNNIVR